MPLTVTTCNDQERWDCLVRQSPQGSIFCESRFLKAIGVEPEFLTIQNDNELVAGFPLLRKDGEVLSGTHPFTLYQGVLLSESLNHLPAHRAPARQHEAINVLLAELIMRQPAISFCLHHTFPDLRPFQWFDYQQDRQSGMLDVILRYTGLIQIADYPDFDAFLSSVRETRRQEARKADRLGVKTEVSEDVDALDGLHELTFQRQGLVRSTAEQRLLRQISAAAIGGRWGRLVVARNAENKPMSASLFIHDGRCGYYLFGANDPDFRNSGAGSRVLMEQIRFCFEAGLKWVDMVGINSPNRGDFKSSFNAGPKPYFLISVARGHAPASKM